MNRKIGFVIAVVAIMVALLLGSAVVADSRHTEEIPASFMAIEA